MHQMKSGALRSLFIDKSVDRPIGEWLQAEYHPTAGYESRFGWHCTLHPFAPHLTLKNRVWVEVELKGEVDYKQRPECQGGRWLLAKGEMKGARIMNDNQNRKGIIQWTVYCTVSFSNYYVR